MVEPALHGPVEVCLFLLLCSDFVIVPGRGGGFSLFRIIFHHFSVPDRTITRCLGKFSFVFPSVSPVAVACFCTKLFGICTKQNIFCTKTGGNSSMFFQHFRDFLCGLRIFLLFSLDFFGSIRYDTVSPEKRRRFSWTNSRILSASALRMQTSTARPLRPSICVIPIPATSACPPEV